MLERLVSRLSCAVLAMLCTAALAGSVSAVTLEWVYVGDPGNPADTASHCRTRFTCGSVPYDYYISKYEVTNAQYAEFLNEKAASDPLRLYNPSMGSDASNGGITRSGVSGSYVYTVKNGFANKPANYVGVFDAMRFANWLHNGQGTGDTETGAYTLLGGTEFPSNGAVVTRNPGATAFLTSENEWFKAAYYDPASASYFDYPAGVNSNTGCWTPTATPNYANCAHAVGHVTDGGAYTNSPSPYGAFDLGGNVEERTEDLLFGGHCTTRGGGWLGSVYSLSALGTDSCDTGEWNDIGFRVAICADVGCLPPPPPCNDGIDNDSDGLVDHPEDRGCSHAGDLSELSNVACDNGLDDDADGMIDLRDPGCRSATDTNEFHALPGGCGLGPELLLAIPFLAGMRRRFGRHGRVLG